MKKELLPFHLIFSLRAIETVSTNISFTLFISLNRNIYEINEIKKKKINALTRKRSKNIGIIYYNRIIKWKQSDIKIDFTDKNKKNRGILITYTIGKFCFKSFFLSDDFFFSSMKNKEKQTFEKIIFVFGILLLGNKKNKCLILF